MPYRPLLLLTLFLMALSASEPKPPTGKPAAGDKTPIVNLKDAATTIRSVETPAVSKGGPSAHDPRFTDKKAWPWLRGKEYFNTATFPKGKLLVWAKPGVSAGERGELNPIDPANWTLDGKPCTEVVFDDTTDVLIPASTSDYNVNLRNLNPSPRQIMRHVTVESGAHFRGGGDGVGRQIHGNIWIKRGGGMSAQGATSFVGSHHTFVRNDNVGHPDAGAGLWAKPEQGRYMFSQYFYFGKATNDLSVEFIGQVITLDEFEVDRGICIISENSMVMAGRQAAPRINKEGTIAILSGGFYGNWSNTIENTDLEVHGGCLQGGLPERPLTRPATLNLHWKNWTKAQYNEGKRDPELPGYFVTPPEWAGYPRVPGLILHDGSTLRSYSTDPKQAMLTITDYRPEVNCTWGPPKGQPIAPFNPETKPDNANFGKVEPGYEALKRIWTWAQALPRGVDLYIGKGCTVDGVTFDALHPGGILLGEGVEPASLKNLIFNARCEGKPTERFTTGVKVNRGKY